MTGPGLDVAKLRGLRHLPHDVGLIRDRIAAHLETHDGYVALSGGKDSLVVLHVVLQVEPNVPVCFFDSGLEFPETYTYLADLADRWRLNLDVIAARYSTLEILVADGSWSYSQPGAVTPELKQVLIVEPAAEAHRRYGAGELWGVRAEESRGRAATYANALRAETVTCSPGCCTTIGQRRATHGGCIRRLDGTVAYGPVWNWKADQIWGYIDRHQLPVNPVYGRLRDLGAPEHFLRISHMLDASRLEEGRAVWLKRGWPDLFERFRSVLPRLGEYT